MNGLLQRVSQRGAFVVPRRRLSIPERQARRSLSRSGARAYLRQNAGVNSTITLKISRRPSSIAMVQIQVCRSLR
jgi:hypothetical protein